MSAAVYMPTREAQFTANALRVVAEVYREDARECGQTSDRLRDQFNFQARESLRIAELLEGGE